MIAELKKDLDKIKSPDRAKLNSRFFKTAKGEYGEGDVFLGITVPDIRKIAKKYTNLTFEELNELLKSEVHDYRQTALYTLVNKYQKANDPDKKKIFDFYIQHSKNINNWDLVDTSAPHIVGNYLLHKDKSILYEFAKSTNLWERRIAIISTFAFIRQNNFEDAAKIAEMLLNDSHDLIHKATGWMLREIGNRNQSAEEQFLKKHYKQMPRTMLRYAIEKFEENLRKKYLNGQV